MQIPLKCVERIELMEDETKVVYNEGELYLATSQSINKDQWFIYNVQTEKYFYIEKWRFEIQVLSYIKYSKFYGEFALPVIGIDGKGLIFLTPTGVAQRIHEMDVTEKVDYENPQYIDSSEVIFR